MSNFIGVENLRFSKLIKDDETGVQYETLKRIAGLVKISVEPTSNTASFYADNQVMESVTRLGEIKVTLETGNLPLSIIAELMGHEYDEENGRIICRAGDVPPNVGLIYTRNKANGDVRHVKIFKVQFGLSKDEATTTGDSVEFTAESIEGIAMPLQHNGEWKDMIEPNESNGELVSKFVASMFITE